MTTQAEKKSTLRPVGNRVVLKRMEKEQTSAGGIILPESAQKKQESAIVIAVGLGKTTKDGTTLPMSVKEGDVVLMDKYSGQEVTLNDEEFIIVKEDDIVAIIEN
ncbi:MAG: co-chaperone GroES [Simkaniaceae bacterium]|nr:co-chaperone GroES [Simkaniaceae bacterium]MCF7852650.1 co-chaperone GroES [Simkaniaceae bacterium]